MNGGEQEPISLTSAKLSKTQSGPASRRLAGIQRLAEDGYGSGVADPGGLTVVVGNLPALKNQPAPLP